jgi:hypothetical protein
MQEQDIPLRSYGRRKGKTLRSARTAAIENVLPEVSISLSMPAKAGSRHAA